MGQDKVDTERLVNTPEEVNIVQKFFRAIVDHKTFLLAYGLIFLSVIFSLRFFYACLASWGFETYMSRAWLILPMDALIMTSPFLLFRRYRWTVLISITLLCILQLTILWYSRQFETLFPLESCLLVENFGIVMPCVPRLIKSTDFLVLLPILVTLVLLPFRKKIVEISVSLRRVVLVILVLSIVGFFAAPYVYMVLNPKTLSRMSSFSLGNYVRERLYCDGVGSLPGVGMCGYLCINVDDMFFGRNVSEEELDAVQTFFQNREREVALIEPITFAETGVSQRKNLIFVIVESLPTWVMDEKPSGIEVTPVLNSLVRSPSTFYVRNVLSQIKDGNSGDGYLLLNTGLLPRDRGASTQFYTNTYYSIAEYLTREGYASLMCKAASAAVWNQAMIYSRYGYSELYDRKVLVSPGGVGEDESFFKNVVPVLQNSKKPFVAEVVTVSSHPPYTREHVHLDYTRDDFDSEELYYYCNVMSYEDRCLGQFLEDLKKAGLYDNSVIVITGDHIPALNRARSGEMLSDRLAPPSEDRYVPFIVLNAPIPQDLMRQIEQKNLVYGQVDLFPTILKIMGLKDVPFTGLGTSIFENTDDCAIYKTGEASGNNKDPLMVEKKRSLWKISDIILRSDYFRDHPLTIPSRESVTPVDIESR